MQSPLNGTQPPWTIDLAALLIANRSATGEAVEVWRALYASTSQCVDFYIRGSYPAGTLETLPYQLLYWGNCTSARRLAAGEVLAQNNSYTNFSVADQPASLFEPDGPCPRAPPPPLRRRPRTRGSPLTTARRNARRMPPRSRAVRRGRSTASA